MQIVWIKRDLRVTDHLPLYSSIQEATSDNLVLPLYVFEPSILSQKDFATQHRNFIWESLQEMKINLQKQNADILVVSDEMIQTLENLKDFGLTKIHSYEEVGIPLTWERDKKVKKWCDDNNIEWIEYPQNHVQRGSTFQKFDFYTYLTKAAKEDEILEINGCGKFHSLPWPSIEFDDLPKCLEEDKADRQKGGESRGIQLIDSFCDYKRIRSYPSNMSSILTADTHCSRLSPYLAWGNVSDRMVFKKLYYFYEKTRSKLDDSTKEKFESSVKFFIERLYWRSAYLHNFEKNCYSSENADLPIFQTIRDNPNKNELLEKWKSGETGYPMIDASMKYLLHHGWINMRMRGMLASFAMYELWLPWKEVGYHLARQFLDYEPAIHWNQIQIHCGSSKSCEPMVYSTMNTPSSEFL